MTRTVYVNGSYLPEAEATVSIFDRGFLMADGVYEVTSVLGGKLIDFGGHAARLERSLSELDMACPVTMEALLEIHRELVRLNNIDEGLIYLPCTAENGFVPAIPSEKADLIYLCYPNNPTGTTATREQLEAWVAYAKENDAIILYDAAYEAFITEAEIPHSIYEVEGARECAIEFRSFSKTAGFTGVRCGLVVVPEELMGTTTEGAKYSFNKLWNRRQTTKFNGVSYPVQKAAAAVYSDEGWAQIKETIDYYMENVGAPGAVVMIHTWDTWQRENDRLIQMLWKLMIQMVTEL